MGLRDADLSTHQHGVIGLGDHFIKPDGVISLPIFVGQAQGRRSAMAEFVVLRDSTAYNIILGRKTINDVEAIINTKLLVMKFVTDDGSIGSIRGDLETAVACDNASLSLRKKSKEASRVFLADLDARVDDKPRPEPEGDLEKFRVSDTEEKFTFVNRNLPHELKEPLVEMIRANGDLFAWTPADMSGIDPKVMSHHLAVKSEACPVAQRRRKMSRERAEEVAKQTASLLEAGFIRELDYSTWLSNVVLVKKHSGKWRMCVDYSDLNKACPKDCFPLPNIDALVDAAAGYRYLSFMDAYSGYNQIPMHPPDEDKTAFITPGETYCYRMMPFSLKDAGATYQRLMNKIFGDLIGKTVEVYVDDILAKTTRPDDLLNDLGNVFAFLRQHGRMMTWSIELSQYDIRYEPWQAIKAQAMADFLVEVTGDPTEETGTRWRLHMDGASNQTSGGTGIILESPAGVVYEQSIKFEFPVSNNQAEYEVLIGGLALAKEVGVTRLEICSNSQVVTSQVNGSYQARDSLLQKYLEKVKDLSQKFEEVTIHHVPRERNTRADLLSKLASTKPGEGNRSLIQGMMRELAVTLHLSRLSPSWLDPITSFLENGKLPDDEKDAKKLRREAAKYAIIQGQLFRKGFNQPLLKCLHPGQTDYVLRKVHEGCCGHHIGGKALARKLIRAGYYWPSMMADSKEFIRKCVKCQENANFHRAPASELSLLTSSRQFSQWGVDLLGPFPVITRFGIPEVVISDNGTQFTDKKFTEFLTGLGIRQKFSSVEHPQTNGQVKSANKIILLGLKKRLDNKKGAWADELTSVLWSYRTTEQSSTGETPFRLTYGLDAVIPVEIGEPSPRLLLKGVGEAVEKDLIDEAREIAHLTETALKQRMALYYNTKVLKREFEPNDLVLRRNDIGLPTPGEGKLAANWEGPYRVKEVIGKGAFKLERLDGKEIPRTWNASNLRRFYS
nr:uncharacterized protein LOC112773098 [Arachis hypogaea]